MKTKAKAKSAPSPGKHHFRWKVLGWPSLLLLLLLSPLTLVVSLFAGSSSSERTLDLVRRVDLYSNATT